MKKIQVTYTEPGGIIWKLLPDEASNYLVIESRDGKLRKIMLSALNISSGAFIFKNEALPKPWWMGLKAVGHNKIILQGYKESNSPEPKGIYVFDLLTGLLLWQNEELNFYSFLNPERIGLVTLGTDQNSVLEVNSVTGKRITETTKNDYVHLVEEQTNKLFPLIYIEDNPHYNTIAGFIGQEQKYKCVGPIEYLEYGSSIIVSFYIQDNKKFTNILLLIDEEGNCLFKDILMDESDGVGMASFFVCKNKLIYIKNKTSIALAELI